MKGVNKLAKIITKIFEIVHWVAVGLMAAVAICSAAALQWLKYFIDINAINRGEEISIYGFEAVLCNSAGEVNRTALLLFAVGAIIIFSLVAMVFRNLHLIIKKSEGTTPFQKDNIRMLKGIGIFSISVPIVSFIMSIILRLFIGVEAAEISLNLDGFTMGILVLCLTQFFAYGAELEKEVDGLL